MIRKLFLLFLLLVVCSGLFAIGSGGGAGGSTAFPFSWNSAAPSGSPLPLPWSANSLPPVRLTAGALAAGMADSLAEGSGLCPAVYRVQKGDTAGSIAGRCGMTVVDLMASNPAVSDPNRIFVGQELVIGPAIAAEPVEIQSAAPGDEVTASATGFPPGAAVRVGLGLSRSGYKVLAETYASEEGVVKAVITIPPYARSGEPAFVLITTQQVPYLQAVSPGFEILP